MEVKFRAWDKIRNEWCDSLDYHSSTGEWTGYTAEGHVVTQKDLEVVQYTGFNDKNGKNIWQGDILSDGLYLKGFNNTALLMHESIYEFDVELRADSEKLCEEAKNGKGRKEVKKPKKEKK